MTQEKKTQSVQADQADAGNAIGLVNERMLKTRVLSQSERQARTRQLEERYQKLLEYAIRNRVASTLRQVFDVAHHVINSMVE